MAGTIYRTSVAGGNTTGANPAATITPAVNDLFLVFCNAANNTNDTPTCSDGNTGGSYDLVGVAAYSNGGLGSRLSCFVRQNLLANTTSTTVTVACGANDAAEVVVVACSGSVLAGIKSIMQFASQANQAAGAPAPAPVFSNLPSPTQMIIGAVANGTNPASMTAPSGFTERQDVGQATPNTGLEVATLNSGASSATVTWGSNSSTAFASFVVELLSGGQGVNVSKFAGYSVLAPNLGIDVSKFVGYSVLAPNPGVNVSKMVGYCVLGSTNVNPPSWDFTTFPDGFVGVPYSQAWNMADAALTVTYSVLSGSLPPGLSLTALSGNQAKISGTPTAAGTYPFTLRATNSYGTADQAFSITINATPAAVGAAYTWIN